MFSVTERIQMFDVRDTAYDVRKNRRWFIENEVDKFGREPITKKVVCPSCRGRGKYVNPGIDSNGISANEFYEDPEFADAYFAGTYDVTCEECQGANVVDSFADPEVAERWKEWMRDLYEDRRTRCMESGGW